MIMRAIGQNPSEAEIQVNLCKTFILKGKSHEIGEGCRWYYCIDLKFVRSRWTFIFNLKLIFHSNFFKMASILVRFMPGFPLGGGFPAEQFVVEIDRRSSSPENYFCERWIRQTARQNEAPLAEFYSLEEGCSGESLSGGVRFSAERGISRRATCLVLAPAVFNRYRTQSTSGNCFFCSGSILQTRRAPSGC
jgi:hypothetical protein